MGLMRDRRPGRPQAALLGVLAVSLEFAVPLAAAELACLDPADRDRLACLYAQLLAVHGDALAILAGGGNQEAFDGLARGLAALAARPCGVSFLGMTWAPAGLQREPEGT